MFSFCHSMAALKANDFEYALLSCIIVFQGKFGYFLIGFHSIDSEGDPLVIQKLFLPTLSPLYILYRLFHDIVRNFQQPSLISLVPSVPPHICLLFWQCAPLPLCRYVHIFFPSPFFSARRIERARFGGSDPVEIRLFVGEIRKAIPTSRQICFCQAHPQTPSFTNHQVSSISHGRRKDNGIDKLWMESQPFNHSFVIHLLSHSRIT